jgi:predicted short-subunit dehydrogenase-like oxidoreductase (DUF2520 family)
LLKGEQDLIMRQVPQYLLVGDGRVARHFQRYFAQLGLKYATWHRGESISNLQLQLQESTHVLLLISDDAIESFYQQHLSTSKVVPVHFSGALVSEHVYGAHPLMSFSHDAYDQEKYESIPFIVDHDALSFNELLPGIPNHHVRLDKSLKAKYHALCVLSGNFSCMLWQKLFQSFEQDLQLPPEIAHPYLMQQTNNLMSNAKAALTGPLVRHDINTMNKNMAALTSDPFQAIYQSFVTCYQAISQEKKS